MYASVYELIWFYLCYSFIGWCIEVAAAAVQKRAFVNRGFVTGPYCPIYGTAAVAVALFLPELKENLLFLFVGGVILTSMIEYITGSVLEKIFHKKWWDYTKERFSVNGYVCLKYSLLWGVMAVVMILFTNSLLTSLLAMIPPLLGMIAAGILLGMLAVDAAGSAVAVLGLQKRAEKVSQFTEDMKGVSKLLENAITRKIQKRMLKAYPAIETAARQKIKKEKTAVFAQGCSFYKLAALFFIGAFLGDLTETVFCYLTSGVLMSRSSVVYGPFSIVWGLGCVMLTALLYQYRERDDRIIFLAGTVLGGAYEYICSVFTELVFGTVFWDYSGFAFNLGGRINLLYCFFWGIVAVVWMKIIYPVLSGSIERIPVKTGKITCNLLLVFMVFNMLISSLALARYTQRNTSAAAAMEATALHDFLDSRFPDERIERIYPNAKIVP